MNRIVRTAYRYKRPPGKRKPVALEVPAGDVLLRLANEYA